MHPLPIPESSGPSPRCPSPVVPGAWPSSNPPTPLHKKPKTCPITGNTPGTSASPDPLHLDHVLDFHQRLSLSLSRPTDSVDVSSSFAPFTMSESTGTSIGPSGSGSIPSDDSDLTRFTQYDRSISRSAFGDTSISTTYTTHSSPERLVTAKMPNLLKHSLKLKHPTTAQNKTNNLCGTPTHRYASPDSTNPSLAQLSQQNQDKPINQIKIQKNDTESSTPSPPTDLSWTQLPRINLLESRIPVFTTTSPPPSPCPTSPASLAPSPIAFASPTSSHHALPFREARTPVRDPLSSYEYEGSPSWETSYGSEYNDEDMLRMGSRSFSPSLLPSSSNVRGQTVVPKTHGSETHSFINIDPRVLPMLTTLSLPNSPDTSSHISLDMNPISALNPSTSPRLSLGTSHHTPGTLSRLPASPSISCSPMSSPSSLSLPPTSLFGAELGIVGEGHIVTFPSPSPSASQFPSSLPSPDLDETSELGGVCATRLEETSAAEYAVAIMSSAWGSDNHASISGVPVLTGVAVDGDHVAQVDEIELVPEARATDEGGPVEEGVATVPGGIRYYARPMRTRASVVLAKVKKLGGKMRKILSRKSKGGRGRPVMNVDVEVIVGGGGENTRIVPDAPDACGSEDMADIVAAVASQVEGFHPGLDLDSVGADDHVPLSLPGPPGLNSRTRKPRPSLTAQTYASASASAIPHSNMSQTSPNAVRSIPSLIHVRPLSLAHLHPQAQNNAQKTVNIKGKGKGPIREQLQGKSKAKNQAPEAISNRRLSLSALSSLARSSSASTPQILISRPRPRSSLTLTFRRNDSAAETESFQSTRYVDGFMPDVPVVHIRQRSAIGISAVGSLRAPLSRSSDENGFATTSTPTRSTPARSTSTPILPPVQTPTRVQAGRKENRRLSLSAISSFAASRWDGSFRKRYSIGAGSRQNENGMAESDGLRR